MAEIRRIRKKPDRLTYSPMRRSIKQNNRKPVCRGLSWQGLSWQDHENKINSILNVDNNCGGNSRGVDFKCVIKDPKSATSVRVYGECKLNDKAQIGNYVIIVNDNGIITGIRITKYTEAFTAEILLNDVLPLIEGKRIEEVMKKSFSVNENLARRYKEKTKKFSTPGKSTPKTVYIVGERAYSLSPNNPYYYNADSTSFRVSRKKDKYVLRAFVRTNFKSSNKGVSLDDLTMLL